VLQIGPYKMASQVVLAPMAGVTDLPFRQLCRRFGAGLVVSEMVTSDSRLWHTRKSQHRLDHTGEEEPRAVQIAGGDPEMMAQAAKMNVERGAQIIDINMGCPAKKVCKKAAGSALLKDEALVIQILQAVVNAVDVPVTLKIRTGWSAEQRNGLTIARIAEDSGIAALAVHGRTRACGFNGEAEYETIAQIKSAVSIPVIANGDITSPEKALQVMKYTGADAVMIGRAAQGRPWLCREIDQFLHDGKILEPPSNTQVMRILLEHLDALHAFYGEYMGVKIARKHVGWYLKAQGLERQQQTLSELASIENDLVAVNSKNFRRDFNQLEEAQDQYQAIENYFQQLAQQLPRSNDEIKDNSVNITKEVFAA
jgi:tRNA-dihydrouridine synthase B